MVAFLITLAVLAQAPASAAPAAPACAGIDQALPARLAGWRAPAPASPSGVALGAVLRATLAADAHFATTGARKVEAGTFGAAFPFSVDRAGNYDVFLSDGAWIDAIGSDGAQAPVVTHGHGFACSSVRRMVTFRLTPGAWRLQIVGSRAPAVTFAILPAP